MKVICINNTPRIFNDNSSDDADKYLTIGKIYECVKGNIKENKYLFIEISDLGGFPNGHRWWDLHRFELVEDVRNRKFNKLS